MILQISFTYNGRNATEIKNKTRPQIHNHELRYPLKRIYQSTNPSIVSLGNIIGQNKSAKKKQRFTVLHVIRLPIIKMVNILICTVSMRSKSIRNNGARIHRHGRYESSKCSHDEMYGNHWTAIQNENDLPISALTLFPVVPMQSHTTSHRQHMST